MKPMEVPALKGVTKMTPLQMNNVRFNKKHTVITPQLLAQLDQRRNGGQNLAKKA